MRSLLESVKDVRNHRRRPTSEPLRSHDTFHSQVQSMTRARHVHISSGPSTPPPQSRRKQQPKTPAKRAKTFSSIAPNVKKRLLELDFGRCLITFQKMPTASQKVARILRRRTKAFKVCIYRFIYFVGMIIHSKFQLKQYEAMWRISPLNVDSTGNLITCAFVFLS